jgi:anti-sigma regulatory factor (Ser/Thr protein kinase)
VASALAWLEALGERHGWPPKALFALTLCADEALANVASHARRADGQSAQLWLACGPTPGGLALRIEDDGEAFDPTAQASPQLAASLDEAQIGGHGLRLMRHYLRHLLYRREGLRNVLLLELAT